uniref:uncharacterized protein isoform X4 n=2 Tax=Myxine glutinosa TaxID=7769 RepID=UPI00358E8707
MFGAIPKCPPVCADSQQALTGMDCCVPGHMMLLTNMALCVLGLAATGVGAMYYLLRSFEQRSHKTAFTGITLAAEAAALANSSPGTLSPKHLGPLIHILRDIDGQQSPDDDLAERILVTLANSAAFTGSQVPELGRRFRWCSRHGGTWRLYILWSCCNDFVRKSQNVRPLTTSGDSALSSSSWMFHVEALQESACLLPMSSRRDA